MDAPFPAQKDAHDIGQRFDVGLRAWLGEANARGSNRACFGGAEGARTPGVLIANGSVRWSGPRSQARSRELQPGWTSYLMACGLIGEPTALLMFNGGATNMNS